MEFVKQFESTHRKQRAALFESDTVHIIAIDYGIEFEGILEGKYIRYLMDSPEYGKIEYYPKSDKVHIKKLGSDGWYENGLRWVIENLKQ